MTSRRELKNYAKQAMSGKYGILILAFVAVQALALISSMISSALFPGEETIDIVLSYAFTFILTLLINVVAAGMNYMYLNIARGKAYSLNELFYFYRHHPDRVIVAGFFMGAGDSFFAAFLVTLLKEGWTKDSIITESMIEVAFAAAADFSGRNCLREGSFGMGLSIEM